MPFRVAGTMLLALACCVPLCAADTGVDALSGELDPAASIAGEPAVVVSAGQLYSFRPSAVVAGPEMAWFEIENLPAWASFDSFSGRLSGIPTEADAGAYPDIRISIVIASAKASLPTFSITVIPQQAPPPRSVSLSWMPPTENVDGSALVDLAGYRIYAGPAPDDLAPLASIDNPGIVRYVVEPMAPGQHFFAVTTLNSWGMESGPSGLVTKWIE